MNELKKYRKSIDNLDSQLLKVLAKRFKVTQKVGEYKAKHNLSATDKKREKELLLDRRSLAKKLGIDQNLASQLFKSIIYYTKKNHKRIKRGRKNKHAL